MSFNPCQQDFEVRQVNLHAKKGSDEDKDDVVHMHYSGSQHVRKAKILRTMLKYQYAIEDSFPSTWLVIYISTVKWWPTTSTRVSAPCFNSELLSWCFGLIRLGFTSHQ